MKAWAVGGGPLCECANMYAICLVGTYGLIPTRGPKQYVNPSLVQPTVLSIKAQKGTMITIIIVKCKPFTNKHMQINTLL